MRKIFIAGNWKMNKTSAEAKELVSAIRDGLPENSGVDVAVCPPFTALQSAIDILGESPVHVGAQNCYWEKSGAYTGEISCGMIKEMGCRYVIIGHSERRQYFGETDRTVNRRLKAALDAGLLPIVCIGETLDEREADKTFDVLRAQLEGGLESIGEDDMSRITIAYEPVWAIGTGKTATPDQAQEAHAFIRKEIARLSSEEIAASVRIQYGGSVKPDNAKELMSLPDVDGALVGGASLKADSFLNIIKNSYGN